MSQFESDIRVVAIAAINQDGVIGKRAGGIPWKIKKELALFRRLTTGEAVLVGHNTYKTMGPLRGRLVIVMSKKRRSYDYPDVVPAQTFLEAYRIAERYHGGSGMLFVAGGRSIYKQYLHKCAELYLSVVDCPLSQSADYVHFPTEEISGFVPLVTETFRDFHHTVLSKSRPFTRDNIKDALNKD